MLPEDAVRDVYRITNDNGRAPYNTYASRGFCEDPSLSKTFRHIVARCIAVNDGDRPSLRLLQDTCERAVEETPNWRHLADEVSELFDVVPTRGGGDDDYVPGGSEGSGESDAGDNDGWVRGFVLRSEARPPAPQNAPAGNFIQPPGNASAGSSSRRSYSGDDFPSPDPDLL